jgi:hypothetical protein
MYEEYPYKIWILPADLISAIVPDCIMNMYRKRKFVALFSSRDDWELEICVSREASNGSIRRKIRHEEDGPREFSFSL